MSALVDMQWGGSFFSLDTWYGYGTGVYDLTAGTNEDGNPVRDPIADGGGIEITGVTAVYNDDGSINTSASTEANTVNGYMGHYNNAVAWRHAPNAMHVYDATYIKLRQVSLSYSLPKDKLPKGIQGLDVGLMGRNLAILFKKSPHTDPEAGLSAVNIQGNKSGAYPAVRQIGFNLNLKF